MMEKVTGEQMHHALMRRIDLAWDRCRACCADIEHSNPDSREMKDAVQELKDAIAASFRLKDAFWTVKRSMKNQ